MYILVGSAALYILAYDRMPGSCKWLIPMIVCSVVYVFGWHDLKTPLEKDDPARKELDDDRRGLGREKTTAGHRNEH